MPRKQVLTLSWQTTGATDSSQAPELETWWQIHALLLAVWLRHFSPPS